ncbi:MAG TPA: insulinase family protein, partial [Caldilineae bacterium]|nr:insulinase family protein [Caldilineae bacterium]
MPAVRSVSIGLYIKVGSRYEETSEAGVSHFIEHMLFKGCQDWPTSLDIAKEIEGRGGYLNASTSHEFTTYWVKIGARHWQRGLRLLANMVQWPLLRAEEIELERGVILDEIYMYRDVPEDLVSQLSNKAMWGDNPLGREIAGEIETVSALTPQAVRDFHARAYRPDRAVLTIAGAIDVAEVQDIVGDHFGDWQAASDPPTLKPAPDLAAQPRHRIAIRPSEQAHLQLAVPGLSRLHPDRYALSLLNVILGDGMTSRLWQRLRDERGLAYSIGSYINMFIDSGVMGVYGGCDAKRLFETLVETMAVWLDLQQTPVPESELRGFKEYVKGRMELSSEDSSAVAAWWGRQVAT